MDNEPTVEETQSCRSCGTRLASGMCPACALVGLLDGGSGPVDDDGAGAAFAESGEVEFGRYLLKERRATGGMGVVYVAEDTKLRRAVALKMIRGSSFADEAELARFTIETEAAATLDHPNIVPIYEVGLLEGQPFFTMKLIEGESLAEMLKSHGGEIPQREAAALLSRIARAVHHAHQHGVLHRDLKPGNILIDSKGTPWLTDFGLAKLSHSDTSLTLSSDHIGTPDYMSPEIASGRVRDASTASDVWALGVILWELLFGAPPFRGSGTVETMRRIVESEPAKLRGMRADADLVTLALRCLEKDPARRLGSAAELSNELERWARGEPIHARPITVGERLWKWSRRNRALAALYAAVAVGGLTILALWYRGESAVNSLTDSNVKLKRTLAVAKGSRLAVEARVQINEDPVRALLLAVEAVEIAERSDAGVLPEAVESLGAILQEVGGIEASAFEEPRDDFNDGYIDPRMAEEYAPIISPDSRWLITFDRTGSPDTGVQAALFDLSDISRDSPALRWTIWDKVGHGQLVSWLPDSRRIVALNEGGDIVFWDLFSNSAVLKSPVSQKVGSVRRDGLHAKHLRISKDRGAGSGPRISVIYTVGEDVANPHGYGEERESFLGWVDVDPGGKLAAIEELPLWPMPWGYSVRSQFSVSPEGNWALLYGFESENETHLIRMVENGERINIHILPEPLIGVNAPAFSASGNWLSFHVLGDTGRLYDLRSGDPATAATTGKDIPSFKMAETYSVAISPDDRWIATAGRTSEIRLAPIMPDAGDWPVSLRIDGEDAYVVRFSDDGRWIAAGGSDRLASLWPMEDITRAPEPMRLRGLPTAVIGIFFSPDCQKLVGLGLHSIHRQFEFGSGSAGTIPTTLPGEDRTINDIALSPDGRWAASACGVANPNSSGGWVKWSALDRSGEHVLGHHGHSATGVAFSPDGEWFASTGRDGMAKVWKCARVAEAITSGGELPEPDFVLDMSETRLQYDRKLAFHPRGTLYATCGDGALFEWDMNDPDPPSTRDFHVIHTIRYILPDLEISRDGNWLAVSRHGWDGAPREGSTQFGNMVLLYDVSQPGPPAIRAELPASFLEFSGMAFSADNRWLATGGCGFGATVWDLAADDIAGTKRVSEVSAHRMIGLGFSPDGEWLALGGSDGRIHLWDWAESGQIRTTSTGSDVVALAWLDKDRLISGGKRGRIEIWQTNIDRLKDLARKTAGRDFSEREQERFGIDR